jgi:hypothetical protein
VAARAVAVVVTRRAAQVVLETLPLLARHKDQMAAQQHFQRQITAVAVVAEHLPLALAEHQLVAVTVAQERHRLFLVVALPMLAVAAVGRLEERPEVAVQAVVALAAQAVEITLEPQAPQIPAVAQAAIIIHLLTLLAQQAAPASSS